MLAYTLDLHDADSTYVGIHIRVEWFSTFFWFLKTYTFLLIRNSIPKNLQFWQCTRDARASHAWQRFHFKISQGPSKLLFFWKLVDDFLIHTSKNSLQKENLKKICLILIFDFQKWANLFFYLYKVIFFKFHFIFSFFLNQRIRSPCRRLQKGV